jgi:hypothetical protein
MCHLVAYNVQFYEVKVFERNLFGREDALDARNIEVNNYDCQAGTASLNPRIFNNHIISNSSSGKMPRAIN